MSGKQTTNLEVPDCGQARAESYNRFLQLYLLSVIFFGAVGLSSHLETKQSMYVLHEFFFIDYEYYW